MYTKEPVNIDVVESLKDYELSGRVFQNIVLSLSPSRDVKDQLLQLSLPQRAVYFSTILDMQVLNGGISQYFGNYDGCYNNEIVQALSFLELYQLKDMFIEACVIYERNTADYQHDFDEFDTKYYKMNMVRSMDNILQEFIRKNLEEFKY